MRSYHVTAGSYYVGNSKAMILHAYLGTCVAVALYDAEAGVGGLIHLLLPEPISSVETFQVEKYASTGFPIFLKALYNAGAKPERLRACIAGGALVGPLKNYDMELDIGGRTVERVMQFITDEKIQVEKSETGGFFTCCLSVNMQTWNCCDHIVILCLLTYPDGSDLPDSFSPSPYLHRGRELGPPVFQLANSRAVPMGCPSVYSPLISGLH